MPLRRRTLTAVCSKRVDALVRSITWPNPWSMNAFIDELEGFRGREVDLAPIIWTPDLGSTGALESHPDHDVIAYAENTTPAHQDYVILHEVGHLISGHSRQCALTAAQANATVPTLDAAALGHLVGSADFARNEEEADMIATLLLARIARGGGTDDLGALEALR